MGTEAGIGPDRVILSANVPQSIAIEFVQQLGAELPARRETATIQSIAEVELAEAEAFIKSHDITTADIYFERINRKYWDGLNDEQRYRVKAGLSNVAKFQGRAEDAGSLLIQAKSYQPHAERARVNEAIGHEFLGKRGRAHELCESLIPEYPHSPHLIACWIRTAPPELSLEELQEKVTAVTDRDAQVNLALAMRCIDTKDFEKAESFSRKAVAASPEWPGPKSWLGQSLLQQQIQLFKPLATIDQVQKLARREVLEEIISVFTEAIDFAERQKSTLAYADCYVFRAMANAFIGKPNEADSDYIKSLQFLSDHSSVHFFYSTFLAQHDRTEEAITQLKQSLAINAGAEATLFLADALLARDRADDSKEATKLLADLARTDDKNLRSSTPTTTRDQLISLRAESFNTVIDVFLKSNAHEEAKGFVSSIPEGLFSRLSLLVAESKIELAACNFAEASSNAEEAILQIAETTLEVDLRAFAFHLMKLERHKDALPLWQRLSGKNGKSSDFWGLIRCAERVKQFGLILKACETAKECGFYDDVFFQEELHVREMFDIERAVSLLEDRLEELPNDRIAKTLLSRLGLILRRPSLVTTNPDLLIGVDKATPPTGAVIVEILRQYGDPMDAVRYAYELARRNFDVPIACQALVVAVMAYRSTPPVFPACVVAGPGVAVRYTEKYEPAKWAVIEDSPSPNSALREYPVNHPLAESLRGKAVGQEFVITQTFGLNRIGLIHEIIPKYIYRTREICENWQDRFPHIPFVQIIRVAKDRSSLEGEQLDLTEMKLVADSRHDQIKEAEEFFREHIVTFCNLAKGLGCSTYEAFVFAALNSKLSIRSNANRPQEIESGLESLKETPVIVLDITAIASISLLGLTELLTTWPGKFVISQDTASSLHEIMEDAEGSTRSAGVFGRVRNGYALQVESPEDSRLRADIIRSFIETIFDKCEVRGCPEMAYMEPDLRDKLSEGLGKDVVESMILARAPGHVLWTEDYVTAGVASQEFAVRRVWSQLVIEHAFSYDLIPNDLYLESTSKLFGFRFEVSSLDHFVIWKAGEMAGWDVRGWPLSQALEVFENDNLDIANSLIFATVTIVGLFEQVPTDELRENVIVQILEHFLMREFGREAIAHLYFALSTLFPKEFFARSEVFRIVRNWAAEVAKRPWITKPPQT